MNRQEFEQAVFASSLDASSRHILMYYAHVKHWKEDGKVWPSVESIARDTGISKSTVVRRLPLLRDLGWLMPTGTLKSNGKGRPSVEYDLHIGVSETPKVPEPEDTLVSQGQDFGVTQEDFGVTVQNFGVTVSNDNVKNMLEHVKEDVIQPSPAEPVEEEPLEIKEDEMTINSSNFDSKEPWNSYDDYTLNCFNEVASLTKASYEQKLKAYGFFREGVEGLGRRGQWLVAFSLAGAKAGEEW